MGGDNEEPILDAGSAEREEEETEEDLIREATLLMERLERAEKRTRSSTWYGRCKNILFEWRTQLIVFLGFLLWVTLSYSAPHLYVFFCAPATFVGYVMSPLYGTALHCAALRWVILNGNTHIEALLVAFGAAAGSFLNIFSQRLLAFPVRPRAQAPTESEEEEEDE
jgi:hypothetical protein